MRINAIIRFTDTGAGTGGHPDLSLPISVNLDRDDINKLVDTSWFKMMIRRNIKDTETRRIRLIHNGRVLNDQTNFRKEVIEPKIRQMKVAGDDSNTLEIYIHCLIGDEMTPSQLEQERELDQKANVRQTDPQLIGFDRLLLQGVSIQEVDDLRRQFRQIHFPDTSDPGDLQGVTDVEENERQQRQIRELEESWLDSTGYSAPDGGAQGRPTPANGGAPGGPQGEPEVSFSNENAIIGLLIGTFLGFVAVVFLMVDDTMFTRSHKMGIFAGVLANICIALMKVWTAYA